MKVKISDLTLADDVNIRDGLREEAVERYMEILDDLPPVEAWKSDGESLLSDGWHRIAAATRLGRDEIEADIHEGGRTEAIVAAIVANTKHGIPLSTKERNRGIVRLAAAGWGSGRSRGRSAWRLLRFNASSGPTRYRVTSPIAKRSSGRHGSTGYRSARPRWRAVGPRNKPARSPNVSMTPASPKRTRRRSSARSWCGRRMAKSASLPR